MADTETATAPRARRGASRRHDDDLEAQVSRLQEDIKSIGASLAKLGDQKVGEAKSQAKTQYKSLVKSGQSVVDDLGDQVNAYESQLVDAIREKPLTAVAAAMGIGFVIAMLSRH